MNDSLYADKPAVIAAIDAASAAADFRQPSDDLSGAFLRTLAAGKPGGRLLELGTGAGRATAWMLAGMNETATLLSVELDESLYGIARSVLADSRLTLVCDRGEDVIDTLIPASFDLVFADTWPGKYHHLSETLALVKPGGFYVVDDMLPQPNWPDGHAEKVAGLIQTLEQDTRFHLVKLSWASGLMLLARR
ncbi:MAG: class I SAM-dependent methyltransferase [Bacteroidetes bacterium]|nr:class I SAM-dependent methyltransferase [Fibrella sp.]